MASLENTIQKYLLLTFFLGLLTVAAVDRSNWMPASAPRALPREPGYIKIPAGAQAMGDFDVLYPRGGLETIRNQAHPVLEVEGWDVPIAANIQSVSFLLDGKPVQPVSAYPMRRTDIAEMFDRLEFLYCGWHMNLALDHLEPGPHFLTLQITLPGGLVGELKRTELH